VTEHCHCGRSGRPHNATDECLSLAHTAPTVRYAITLDSTPLPMYAIISDKATG